MSAGVTYAPIFLSLNKEQLHTLFPLYPQAAREAYHSVITVTLMKPSSQEFYNFTQEVRRRALIDYNYDYGPAEVGCVDRGNFRLGPLISLARSPISGGSSNYSAVALHYA